MVFQLQALEIFTLNNDKSGTKINIGEYFWRKFSSAHVPTILKDSLYLMEKMLFEFQIGFFGRKINETKQAIYFTKINAN